MFILSTPGWDDPYWRFADFLTSSWLISPRHTRSSSLDPAAFITSVVSSMIRECSFSFSSHSNSSYIRLTVCYFLPSYSRLLESVPAPSRWYFCRFDKVSKLCQCLLALRRVFDEVSTFLLTILRFFPVIKVAVTKLDCIHEHLERRIQSFWAYPSVVYCNFTFGFKINILRLNLEHFKDSTSKFTSNTFKKSIISNKLSDLRNFSIRFSCIATNANDRPALIIISSRCKMSLKSHGKLATYIAFTLSQVYSASSTEGFWHLFVEYMLVLANICLYWLSQLTIIKTTNNFLKLSFAALVIRNANCFSKHSWSVRESK